MKECPRSGVVRQRAVTKAVATRYRSASKKQKAVILDELCATTGWHREHARNALRTALGPRPVKSRRGRPRAPRYGEDVMAVLRKVWATMEAPAGKRMAPFLPEIVDRLRMCGQLDITDALAAKASRVSAATIDRRFAPERKKLELKGRSGTKPGTLLKSQIPIRTWADWNEQMPGPEADREDPGRREGHQALRHRQDPLPEGDGRPAGHQEGPDCADTGVQEAEPRTDPERHSRPPRPAPQARQGQARTRTATSEIALPEPGIYP